MACRKSKMAYQVAIATAGSGDRSAALSRLRAFRQRSPVRTRSSQLRVPSPVATRPAGAKARRPLQYHQVKSLACRSICATCEKRPQQKCADDEITGAWQRNQKVCDAAVTTGSRPSGQQTSCLRNLQSSRPSGPTDCPDTKSASWDLR